MYQITNKLKRGLTIWMHQWDKKMYINKILYALVNKYKHLWFTVGSCGGGI